MEDYKFPSEPVARAESIVKGPNYRFTVIDNNVLRYEWAADGVFEDRASTFAINRNFPTPEFRVHDETDQLDIITSTYQLTYDKQRFSPNGLAISFTSKQTLWGVEWRYGNDPVGNMGGTARTVDDIDGRCDLGFGIISNAGYSVLDDSSTMIFDGKGFVTTRRAGDRIDGYLFSYGYDFKGAMRSFYAISGKQPSVPRWCLGNWWSRYYTYEQNEYLELMDKFKTENIPLSVAVIDMDWHYVKEDHVPHAGWTGYTWNDTLFPDPTAFQKGLHDRGLKITLNDHPHAGVHHHEEVYEEMAKILGHDTKHKTPILFDPTSQEFMHAFLNVLHRNLEDKGCDFWWIDWQQGSYTRIPGFDPLWLLNHFHFLDSKQQTSDSQALIFSRYAGPGSHRYPVGFSGDSIATWASLEFQPEFTATASNIGYGWWSHDIGGHMGGARDDELTVRWVQSGMFSPILRLHSSNSRWQSKEPWLYRTDSEIAMREALQLRHRLVPYIYSMSVAEPHADLPLVQPLYWEFPKNERAFKHPTEFYFGSALVVSPIVSPSEKSTNLAKSHVWVPPSRHVDILTGMVYDGDQEIDMYRSLQKLPVLAKGGAIIPLDGATVPANGCPNPEAFEVLVVVGADGAFDIVENNRDDAGSEDKKEAQRSIPIKFDQAAGRLTVAAAGRAWTFKFLSTNIKTSNVHVSIGGSASKDAHTTTTDTVNYIPSTIVTIPTNPKATTDRGDIVIELGADPQLAITDPAKAIEDLLLDFQISADLKDRIWQAANAEGPTTLKISGLLSLGLEQHILGPIAERLLADSRLGGGDGH